MSSDCLNCSWRGGTAAFSVSFHTSVAVLQMGGREAPVRGMLWPCPPLSSAQQLTYIRGLSLSRTSPHRHTTEREELTSSTKHPHTTPFNLLHSGSSQRVSFTSESLTCFFIPRKPWGGQSRENWGLTPDALLLAPRATERFLRPVKPAGCAQGSKIQQIPGQLSGDSYFVNGHTELKTLKISESGGNRLNNSIKDQACCSDEYKMFRNCFLWQCFL